MTFLQVSRNGMIRIFGATMFFAVLACGTEPTVPDVRPLGSVNTRQDSLEYLKSHLTLSDRIALEVPGFAGAYMADGAYNILLVGDLTTERKGNATAVVNKVFDSLSRPMSSVKFLPATYSLVQLRLWESRLPSFWRDYGIVSAGVDEVHNKLKIGLQDLTVVESLVKDLENVGILRDALSFEKGEALQTQSNLQHHRRPVPAGFKVTIRYGPSSGSRHTCTQGLHFWHRVNSQIYHYSLLNAHCVQGTGFGGWEDNQKVFQPIQFYGNFWQLGTVRINPPSSSSLPGCPSGFYCKLSDAAAMTVPDPYNDIALGQIPITTVRGWGPGNSGSTVLNSPNSHKFITKFNYGLISVGDTIEKVGMASGATAGLVSSSCTDQLGTDGYVRLCQGLAGYYSTGGDSGAPVVLDQGGETIAVGIHWGGNGTIAAFSPLSNTWTELAPHFPGGAGLWCFIGCITIP